MTFTGEPSSAVKTQLAANHAMQHMPRFYVRMAAALSAGFTLLAYSTRTGMQLIDYLYSFGMAHELLVNIARATTGSWMQAAYEHRLEFWSQYPALTLISGLFPICLAAPGRRHDNA